MTGEDSSGTKDVSTLTSKPQTEARRRIDPYELSSGDNPGSIISQPQHRGPNYDELSLDLRKQVKILALQMVVFRSLIMTLAILMIGGRITLWLSRGLNSR